jgi:hypothetical protein
MDDRIKRIINERGRKIMRENVRVREITGIVGKRR